MTPLTCLLVIFFLISFADFRRDNAVQQQQLQQQQQPLQQQPGHVGRRRRAYRHTQSTTTVRMGGNDLDGSGSGSAGDDGGCDDDELLRGRKQDVSFVRKENELPLDDQIALLEEVHMAYVRCVCGQSLDRELLDVEIPGMTSEERYQLRTDEDVHNTFVHL